MGRIAKTLVMSTGALLLLTSCAPEPVDVEAMSRWEVAEYQAAESSEDLIAVLSAKVAAGDDSEIDEPAVKVNFNEPTRIDRVGFACFGEGTMRGWATSGSGGGSNTHEFGPFECSESPHEIDPAIFGAQLLDHFGFTGFDSDRESTWQVTLHHD